MASRPWPGRRSRGGRQLTAEAQRRPEGSSQDKGPSPALPCELSSGLLCASVPLWLILLFWPGRYRYASAPRISPPPTHVALDGASRSGEIRYAHTGLSIGSKSVIAPASCGLTVRT